MNLVDLVAVVSGITGMFFGVYSYLMTKANMIKEYFMADDADEMRMARKSIYNFTYNSDQELMENTSFAKVCSHYHFYGLLLKKHYLPRWIFGSANGSAIIRCYEKSIKYILLRRNNDVYYAEYFEWLYNWLLKHRQR